ncbi:NRDE family protein [Methylococcus sp. ANG]|uniref:NRDE family protein n=1 Tax=unclassified Methylococcus TaxID=2618889 RepID=UPI001C52A975|nr:NRDE family protein [Methylococcus sp. Mc7]QXP84625.1 NRDE family protein [Methylococcus sp. Mc7]
MSVAAIAWGAHPDFPLALIANRDERHDRPTSAAGWWTRAPECLAGEDQMHGGTWLAVTRDGRFSLVTAYRDGSSPAPGAPSRGRLPLDYLESGEDPTAHARRFIRSKGDHAPYNLLLGSPRQVFYAGTRSRLPIALTPGIHTLSNGLLDEPWPKCAWLDRLFGGYVLSHGGYKMLLSGHSPLEQVAIQGAGDVPRPAGSSLTAGDIAAAGFALLASRTTYSRGLPDTGIGPEEEERLSACFVTGSDHGTRSSTVLVMGRDGHVRFEERSFDASGNESGRVLKEWDMDPAVFSGSAED